jgi:putative toxin-antitoxin system antitoxin component (TIGR02293 family)
MKSKVLEPAEAYQLLSKYGQYTSDKSLITLAALKGLDSPVFSDVIRLTGFPRDKVAGWLDLSLKTIMKYEKEKKQMNSADSELLLKIIALFEKGIDLFATRDHFLKWLEKPAFGLGSLVPVDMMKTSGGIDLIMDELVRIEYGDLA